MSILNIAYRQVAACPLCHGTDTVVVEPLARTTYTFGPVEIALPAEGIAIRRCNTCALAYKDRIPTPEALSQVMGMAATAVWKRDRAAHPHRALLRKLGGATPGGLLDIGAANGEVLAAVDGAVARRSAFDIVPYEACRAEVSGEYLLGQFEDVVPWSGEPYALVTAFDVFEHFGDASAAFARIAGFVARDGRLLLETGDSDRAFPSIGRWYYAALFEHTVFWNRASLEWGAQQAGMRIENVETVNHKGRLGLHGRKAALVWLVHKLGRSQMLARAIRPVIGFDANLIAHPSRRDHLLATLQPR